ncbi:hypothetical protein ACLMJK_004086 [Lecanora helva]
MSYSQAMSESQDNAPSQRSIYDTYLCTEPAGDVSLLIRNGPDEYSASMRTLQRSADYFAERDQFRAVERLQWEMGRVHMRHAQWERAARVLTPLWQTLSWRKAGWWELLREVDYALRDCTSRIRNFETLIAVNWELLSDSLTSRQDLNYDFSKILEPHAPLDARPRCIVKGESTLSCIAATFAFSAPEGNVGISLQYEVVISSRAQTSSKPLVLSQIKVAFSGNLRDFAIKHEPGQAPRAKCIDGLNSIYQLPLTRVSPKSSLMTSDIAVTEDNHPANDLMGSADLTIVPGATKVFLIEQIPREAEDVEVASLTLCLKEEQFDLDVILTEDEQISEPTLWLPSEVGLVKKTLKAARSSAVKILPKPPKMRIEVREIASIYYTDEIVCLNLWVMNEEDEEASVTLEARVIPSKGPLPCIYWEALQKGGGPEAEHLMNHSLDEQKNTTISKFVGNVTSYSNQSHRICVQGVPEAAEYTLEVRARYYLVSDPETLISKFNSARIPITPAFEVSYSFMPVIANEPWPSYFDVDELGDAEEDSADEGAQSAKGLTQTWVLTPRLYSLASESLDIHHFSPRILEIHDAALCDITPSAKDTSELISIPPNEVQERNFTLKAQKIDLEDRRSTFLDLRMEIVWQRKNSKNPTCISHLAVPELVIPFGEPRVLAIARTGDTPPGVTHLSYVIENPSTYALTFNVTMDPSEEFAFSGPKNVSVETLPLSRHTIQYNLMPLVKGTWISPQLRVFDTHFHKALKVSATEGMRSDKKGLSVWADAESQD